MSNILNALQSALHQESQWDRTDADIEHSGNKIILPADPSKMSTREAIAALERKAQDEETVLDVYEIIRAYPDDALVAFYESMREKYGWASPKVKMTMFGPRAPDLLTIQTGPKEGQSVQVPFGQFTLPSVENPIETHRTSVDGQPCLVISGSVKKREAEVVKQLAQATRERLKTKSIYLGKAIRLRVDSDGDLNYDMPPEFLETDYIQKDELILNDDEFLQVQASLWSPIENTEACVQHGIPLNRGVLLEGTYGTGKTMTANVTSKVCVDNGWTYILLDDVRGLKEALLFAQRYAPAVVFAEDIDRVAGSRDQRGNDLLNTIDGVLTKDSKVISVMTTNHVERLDKAMLRPGRLDAVVTVRPPEEKAVIRLINLYSRNLLAAGEDLKEVGKALAGNIPATIREVVERSKLAMIASKRDQITASDLLVSGNGMKRHLELLSDVQPEISDEEKLGKAFVAVLSSTSDTSAAVSKIQKAARDVRDHASYIGDKVDAMNRQVASSEGSINGAIQKVKSDTEEILSEVA